MTARRILMCGALAAFIGVAGGAFGAHGLRPRLSEDMMRVFDTGVRYHVIHGLAMLGAGLSQAFAPVRWFSYAAWAFLLGMVLFSGSLYVMSLSGSRALGMITPLGGVCFLVGWGLLAWGYGKSFPSDSASLSSPHGK
jgi:uncharacterized membrane protein YgdD (TMEM256/DUF423 family)